MPTSTAHAPIWWLNPGKLVLFFILPIYAFVTFAVPAAWPELIVLRSPVYMDSEYAMLGAGALLVLGVAALLGCTFDLDPHRARRSYQIDERFLLVIGSMSVIAYLIWFWPVLARGELIVEREELNQTPGITSFTQFGVPYVVSYMLITVRAGQRTSASVRILFRILVFLALARVYIQSERLALIEIFVPAVAIGLAHFVPARPWQRHLFSALRLYGPILGIPALMVFFGATEFVRSWSSYSETQDISMIDFMVSRVATYYYTALNNGAGMLATSEWPDFELIHVLEWIYRLPFGIGDFFWDSLTRHDVPSDVFLARFGDPEFNNMSGIFPIFFDLGVVGGFAYFALLGFLMGVAYSEFNRGHPLGSLLFPSMLVACSELLRIMYLNNTRSFLILIGCVLASTQVRPLSAKLIQRATGLQT